MKSIFKKIIILFIIVLIFALMYIFYTHSAGNRTLYIETGDDFTTYTAYTLNGEKINLDSKGINIYFYLSDRCASCIDMLGLYEQLSNIDFMDEIKFYCLWEDTIPKNKIKKSKIDEKNMLSLQGEIILQSAKPYFYIVKDGIIDFSTYDYNEVIDRIIFYADKEKLKESVYKSLFKNDKLNNAIIFVIENQFESIQLERDKYDKICVISSYRDEGNIYDEFGLYKKIFEVDLYLSIVFLRGKIIVNEVIENSH